MLQTLDYLAEKNKSVILRCPIIPGINDQEAHFEAIRKIKQEYINILEVEIMPYHKIGISKAEQVGIKQTLYSTPDKDSINFWKSSVSLEN